MTLKELRVKNKLTLVEIGKMIGVSAPQVFRYETGENRLPIEQAKELGSLFGINWWELYPDQEKE